MRSSAAAKACMLDEEEEGEEEGVNQRAKVGQWPSRRSSCVAHKTNPMVTVICMEA